MQTQVFLGAGGQIRALPWGRRDAPVNESEGALGPGSWGWVSSGSHTKDQSW